MKDYKEQFRPDQRVVILDGMIEGVVKGHYDKVDERVKVETAMGHVWLVKPDGLVHLVEKFAEK